MTPPHPIKDPQTPAEERVNWITHGLGAVLSLVGLGALIAKAAPQGFWALTACGLYGISLVAMFAISTFYHAVPHGPLKWRARLLDHCAIYFLIAGSYTPFMLLALGGWRGWTVMATVWLLTVVGTRHKLTSQNPFGAAGVVLCLLMGWLITMVWHPLVACLPPTAMACLVAGGVAYTAGVPFYAWRNLPHNHGIWHIFTLLGAGCHYTAVLLVI